MTTTTNEIYEFTEMTIKRSREHGYEDIAQQLEDAMYLGSSGLEILGAIKVVFVAQRKRLGLVIDNRKIEEVIEYVNTAFGIE